MGSEKIIYEGVTFDDILLLPAKSQILPRETNISTKLTKNITLNITFISDAMDTVTTSQMAIAMAAQGGIGIIHKICLLNSRLMKSIKLKDLKVA